MNEHKWEVGPVKLVNGSDAKIFQINDRNNCMKYVGVRRVGLDWHPFAWDLCGTPSDSAFNENKLSLAPPPKKTMRFRRFICLYPDGSWSTHLTEGQANKEAHKSPFAIFEIDREVTEGEGLAPNVWIDAANVRSENQ